MKGERRLSCVLVVTFRGANGLKHFQFTDEISTDLNYYFDGILKVYFNKLTSKARLLIYLVIEF